MKRRRDATRIIYEILSLAESGVSKTHAVYQANLNFRLMAEYLSFLLEGGYLHEIPNGSSRRTFKLTGKGARLLSLLDVLEKEVGAFRPALKWPVRKPNGDRSQPKGLN